MHFTDFLAKYHFVKFGHHLSGLKLTQIATLLSRWTLGMFFGDRGKIGPISNLLLQSRAGIFTFHQDVSGSCGWHRIISRRE